MNQLINNHKKGLRTLLLSCALLLTWQGFGHCQTANITVECYGSKGGATLTGNSLADALSTVQIDTLTEIIVTNGKFDADDWLYLRDNRNRLAIRHFTIEPSVSCADVPSTTEGNPYFQNRQLYIGILADIERLGDYAFAGLDSIYCNIDLVEHVGNSTFRGSGLIHFMAPLLQSVGDYAFAGCDSLSRIMLGYNPPTVGAGAFDRKTQKHHQLELQNPQGTQLPADTLRLAQYLYSLTPGWDAAKSTWHGFKLILSTSSGLVVNLNDDPTPLIGSDLEAAMLPVHSTSQQMPTKITVVSGRLYYRDWYFMGSMPTINTLHVGPGVNADMPPAGHFPNNIKELEVHDYIIQSNAFENSGLQKVSLPNVWALDKDAFKNCRQLREVHIPNCLIIGDCAFVDCAELTTITDTNLLKITGRAFAGCSSLEHIDLNNVKESNLLAFAYCDRLKAISMPNLQKFVFEPTTSTFPHSISSLTLGSTPPTFYDNSNLSCATDDVKDAFTKHYLNLRYIALADPQGTPLTGEALATAIAAYKADAGWDNATQKWYGLTLLDGTQQLYQLSAAGRGSLIDISYQQCGADSSVVAHWSILPHYIETIAPTVSVYKTGDPSTTVSASIDMAMQQISFTMPAHDVTIEVSYTPNVMELTLNGSTPLSGLSLAEALRGIDPLQVNSLHISKSEMFDTDDWQYLMQLSNIEELTMHPDDVKNVRSFAETMVTLFKLRVFEAPVSTIPPDCFESHPSIERVSLPYVTQLHKSTFPYARKLTTVHLHSTTTVEVESFINLLLKEIALPKASQLEAYSFLDCPQLSLLQLGQTPPTVGTQAFYGCPSPRYLQLVGADGTPLTGDALTTATNAYKSDAGWDATAQTWHGWTLYHEAPQLYQISTTWNDQMGTLIASPSMAPQGASIEVNAGPAAGYAFTAVRAYQTGNPSVSIPLSRLPNGSYSFEQPAHDVTVEGTFEANHMELTINNSITRTGNTLMTSIDDIAPLYINSLEVTKAKLFADIDWFGITLLPNLEHLRLNSGVDTIDNNNGGVIFDKLRTLTIERLRVFNFQVDADSLRSVSLPQTEIIGTYDFMFNNALNEAYLPEVRTVELGAFQYCGLTALSLPKADSLLASSFAENTQLSTASLPLVKKLGQGVFRDCHTLSFMQLGTTPPVVEIDAFSGCHSPRYLQLVGADGTPLTGDALTTATNAYKSDAGWDNGTQAWHGWILLGAPAVIAYESICEGESYTWAGQTYSQSGAYLDLSDIANPKTLMLTTIPVARKSISTEICAGESFDLAGTTYTQSGLYSHTLVSQLTGCDSIVTVNLRVLPPAHGELSHTATGSYEWYGTTYDASGDYVHTLTTANGCDSTVTLHLTIVDKPSGLRDNALETIALHPNPTTGELWVTVPSTSSGSAPSEVRVYNAGGQLVLRQPTAEGRTRIDLSRLPAGVYIVRTANAAAKVVRM